MISAVIVANVRNTTVTHEIHSEEKMSCEYIILVYLSPSS